MAIVIIYTKDADPYSIRAKSFLQHKGVAFFEMKLPEHTAEMVRLTGETTTPQILINGKHIGSFEQLGSLELQGKLDALLSKNE